MTHWNYLAIYGSGIGFSSSLVLIAYVFRSDIKRLFSEGFIPSEDLDMRLSISSFVLVFVISLLLGMPFLLAILTGIVGLMVIPRVILRRRREQYIKDFDFSLIESLTAIATSLKAGLTLKMSLEVATNNCHPAFAGEIRQALRENKLGLSLNESLDNVRARIGTMQTNISFGALVIGNRLGGNMPLILKRIVHTIRERDRVEGKLKSLTAQGRMQAWLLCMAPPGLAVGLYLFDPGKFSLLTDTLGGNLLLVAATVLEIIGIYAMRQILKLEV